MFQRTILALLVLACARQSKHDPSHEHATHEPAAHGAHGPLVHRFENAEEWLPIFEEPGRDAWQKPDEVIRLLAIAPGMTVADLGAGTGYFLRTLSLSVGNSGRVIALDVEADMVRFMRERSEKEGLHNVTVAQVPADDPQLTGVDRVLVVDTWHHIEHRETYSKKLYEGLSPGGVVAVVDFTLDAPHGPPPHARIPADEVARDLRSAGFDVEIANEDLPDQYVVLGKKR